MASSASTAETTTAKRPRTETRATTTHLGPESDDTVERKRPSHKKLDRTPKPQKETQEKATQTRKGRAYDDYCYGCCPYDLRCWFCDSRYSFDRENYKCRTHKE